MVQAQCKCTSPSKTWKLTFNIQIHVVVAIIVFPELVVEVKAFETRPFFKEIASFLEQYSKLLLGGYVFEHIGLNLFYSRHYGLYVVWDPPVWGAKEVR
jgi:hypothetical protein